VAGIGQLVQIHNFFVGMGNPIQHKIGTNETSTAGDQDCHVFSFQKRIL
jgi:hypothetical protein